ncbi:MAG TPA: histidine kinase [Bacteroidia bacterium]
MLKRKLTRHLFFWLVFFSISFYSDLYLSESFSSHPTLTLFLQSTLSLALLYIPKILVVYTFLYLLIPGWIEAKNKTSYYLLGIATLLIGALFMRFITQVIVWKYVYGAEAPDLNFQQIFARFIYSFLDLLQITAIACAIKLFRLRVNAVQKEKKLVQEKLNAEMQHLRSQTNPHFLFNTLNSIYALSRSKSEQAPDAVMKLSKILRYMLYESGHSTKSLRDELAVIDSYIQLQQLRFGDRVRIEIEKNIDSEDAAIAPLLLLPLVENAYKHSNQSEAIIKMNIYLRASKLKVTVSNPVAELTVPDSEKEGIGLGNIKRQLELLYRDFNLEYAENKGIFMVNLEIDLSSYAETELFDTGR